MFPTVFAIQISVFIAMLLTQFTVQLTMIPSRQPFVMGLSMFVIELVMASIMLIFEVIMLVVMPTTICIVAAAGSDGDRPAALCRRRGGHRQRECGQSKQGYDSSGFHHAILSLVGANRMTETSCIEAEWRCYQPFMHTNPTGVVRLNPSGRQRHDCLH